MSVLQPLSWFSHRSHLWNVNVFRCICYSNSAILFKYSHEDVIDKTGQNSHWCLEKNFNWFFFQIFKEHFIYSHRNSNYTNHRKAVCLRNLLLSVAMSQILMDLMLFLQITPQMNINDITGVPCFHCHWYLTQKGHPQTQYSAFDL